MTIDYNQGRIAERYQKAKEQPWRSRVETYSFMKRIGDVKGKKVVDMACGEGHFARRLRRAGAASMLGVDVSERMIELARAQEKDQPLGIEYRVEDARTIVPRPPGRGSNATIPELSTSAPSCERHAISSFGVSAVISESHSTCVPAGPRAVQCDVRSPVRCTDSR